MKTNRSRFFEYACIGTLVLIYAGLAFWHSHPYPFRRVPLKDGGAYFALSDPKASLQKEIPVIIHIANLFERPNDILPRCIGQFQEPVLLVWSDLLFDLDETTAITDTNAWERKRREFPRLLSRYREIFRFDERRVYLTGFGFGGAYAWMLAYDRPDLFTGVLAISAPCYSPPIQYRLDSGKGVVTVVIYGGKNPGPPGQLAEAQQIGQAIQTRNRHSRFIFKPEEDGSEVAKYWEENLRYVLQFRKE